MDGDEVEIIVRQVGEDADEQGAAWAALFERLTLVGIGALALTGDEIERGLRRLSERGALAQQQGAGLLHAIGSREARQIDSVATRFERFVEARVDRVLGQLNVPSKRDIDDLSVKIAQLSARVEEFTRKQEAR